MASIKVWNITGIKKGERRRNLGITSRFGLTPTDNPVFIQEELANSAAFQAFHKKGYLLKGDAEIEAFRKTLGHEKKAEAPSTPADNKGKKAAPEDPGKPSGEAAPEDPGKASDEVVPLAAAPTKDKGDISTYKGEDIQELVNKGRVSKEQARKWLKQEEASKRPRKGVISALRDVLDS